MKIKLVSAAILTAMGITALGTVAHAKETIQMQKQELVMSMSVLKLEKMGDLQFHLLIQKIQNHQLIQVQGILILVNYLLDIFRILCSRLYQLLLKQL